MGIIEQLEEIYEMLVGADGMQRYTHEELIERIKQLLDTDKPFDWKCPVCGGDVESDPRDYEDVNGDTEWEWVCMECKASISTKDVVMVTEVTEAEVSMKKFNVVIKETIAYSKVFEGDTADEAEKIANENRDGMHIGWKIETIDEDWDICEVPCKAPERRKNIWRLA